MTKPTKIKYGQPCPECGLSWAHGQVPCNFSYPEGLTKREKIIKMFKDGWWVEWDGSDVDQVIIEEELTLKEFKKHFPEEFNSLSKTK